MPWTISREYDFAAAHSLKGHPKCGRLHGHNYKVVVKIATEDLDAKYAWIMDYAELDAIVKPIIQELDHKFIASTENLSDIDPNQDDYVVLPIPRSTAECLAKYLVDKLSVRITIGRIAIAVTVSETPRSSATYYTDGGG